MHTPEGLQFNITCLFVFFAPKGQVDCNAAVSCSFAAVMDMTKSVPVVDVNITQAFVLLAVQSYTILTTAKCRQSVAALMLAVPVF
jgi:hypothetical protein